MRNARRTGGDTDDQRRVGVQFRLVTRPVTREDRQQRVGGFCRYNRRPHAIVDQRRGKFRQQLHMRGAGLGVRDRQ